MSWANDYESLRRLYMGMGGQAGNVNNWNQMIHKLYGNVWNNQPNSIKSLSVGARTNQQELNRHVDFYRNMARQQGGRIGSLAVSQKNPFKRFARS